MKTIRFSIIFAAIFVFAVVLNAQVPATISLPPGCAILAQTGQLTCPIPTAAAVPQPCCVTIPAPAPAPTAGCCKEPLDEEFANVMNRVRRITKTLHESKDLINSAPSVASAPMNSMGTFDPWWLALLALAVVGGIIYFLVRRNNNGANQNTPAANQFVVPLTVQVNPPPPVQLGLTANLVPPPAPPCAGCGAVRPNPPAVFCPVCGLRY